MAARHRLTDSFSGPAVMAKPAPIIQKGRSQGADDGRHFGLVVDDKGAVRRALEEAGSLRYPANFSISSTLGGNRVEIVRYDHIQFTKASKYAARHGAATSLQKRERDQGARRQGHEPELRAGAADKAKSL